MTQKQELSNSDKWKNVIYIIISAVTILTFIYQSSASVSRAQDGIKAHQGKIEKLECENKVQDEKIVTAQLVLTGVNTKLENIADDIREQKDTNKAILKCLLELKK